MKLKEVELARSLSRNLSFLEEVLNRLTDTSAHTPFIEVDDYYFTSDKTTGMHVSIAEETLQNIRSMVIAEVKMRIAETKQELIDLGVDLDE